MSDVRPDNAEGNSPDTAATPQSQPVDPPSRASNLAALAILLLIFLTPAFGFWWLRGMAQQLVERNSLSHTRDMLIRHMARTRGEWPASWDDLKPDFGPANVGYGTHTLKELKDIIEIDFTFDPESVLDARPNLDKPPRVVWLRKRSDTADVRAANARLVSFLRNRGQARPSTQPSR